MEQVENQYIKGFNNGYLLAKYEPSLLDKLFKQLAPSGEYLEGMFSGKEEYELEHSRMQMDELKRLRNEALDHNHDLEMN